MTEPIRFLLTITEPAADTPEAIEHYRRWIIGRIEPRLAIDVTRAWEEGDDIDEIREAYSSGFADGRYAEAHGLEAADLRPPWMR